MVAGLDHIVTINGSGFGSTRGSGKVEFKNAIDGGVSSLIIQNPADNVWSENEIKVRLRSTNDNNAYGSGTTLCFSGILKC